MDLTYSAAEEAFRAEAREWLEANVPSRLPSGDTADGFAPAPRLGEAALRGPLGGRLLARGLRRPRRSPLGVADLRGGVLPGRAPRSGSPRTASSCWPRPCSSSAPPSNRTATCPHGRGRRPLVPGLVGARRRQRPGRHQEPRRARRRGGRLAAHRPEDLDAPARAFCTHLFGLFRTDPNAERHRGMTYFMVPLDAAASPSARFDRLDGDDGFAEVFLDDVLRPRRRRPRRRSTRAGAWHGDDRLRARPHPALAPAASWPPPSACVDLYRATAVLPARPRRRGRPGLDRRRGLSPLHLQTVARIAEGALPGAESSLNKIFWSELDVRLHETALRLLGSRSRAEPQSGAPWIEGSSSPWPARSTPAPTRSSATSSPSRRDRHCSRCPSPLMPRSPSPPAPT